ncbi:MAG: adenylate/guanylate cyclase domain-containing protein, partial [Rhodocyclales bacterium]|nr:adenylate/guanylate cyclase domain-containing protein [Rhodocyclales bacterium]
GDARDWLPPYAGGVASRPQLTAAAAGAGAISLVPDSDGVLRAMPLLYQVQGTLYPTLGLEALRLAHGVDKLTLRLAARDAAAPGQVAGIRSVAFGAAAATATAPDGRVWLRFRRFAPERYLSATDLLDGKTDPQLLRDHIVFVGATAKGLGDTVYSPLGEAIPGVEGHVQLTEQLWSGTTLLRPTWENDLVTALLLGAWLALALLLARARPLWAASFAALAVAALFALSAWLFRAQALLLDPFYPALAVGALFVVMAVPRHWQAERERRWIGQAFARYVSPNRVRYLQAHPQELELGGVQRECSFVMTDIAGFTALIEGQPPETISRLLNDYLDGMVDIAFRHDGTLDRIVGDAVAVMFSAPLAQADHAARALACALDMDRFAEDFRRRWQAQGIAFGRTRIGVHSGSVLVGNFGGKAMLDYRALGDPINTAARLESINAQLGTRVCVSGATAALCPDFVGRPVGELVLKGKTKAVAAFEPLTAEQAAAPAAERYRAAYALMAAQRPTAAAAFAELRECFPDDPLIAFHAARLAAGETGSRLAMTSK